MFIASSTIPTLMALLADMPQFLLSSTAASSHPLFRKEADTDFATCPRRFNVHNYPFLEHIIFCQTVS